MILRYPVYKTIKARRSMRSFDDRHIKRTIVKKILDAGRWAPSGLNNQPWRFVVVWNEIIKEQIASCTEYSRVIKRSNCVILVFLDKNNSYHLVKDAQAIGACIQNMLLCAWELGVRGCWMGEILNQKKKVNKILKISSRYDLMAALALGYSKQKTKSKRIAIDKLILKEFV